MSEEYDDYDKVLSYNQWCEEEQVDEDEEGSLFSLVSLADFSTDYSNSF